MILLKGIKKKLLVISIVIFAVLSVSCSLLGSEENEAEEPKLETAESFEEHVNILVRDHGNSWSRFLEYDASEVDFPEVEKFSAKLINGAYLHYEKFSYPSANGEFRFHPMSRERELSVAVFDLTNGLEAKGEYQTFYGVKDNLVAPGPDQASNADFANIPIAIITRGIAYDGNTPLYKMIQVFEGRMTNGSFSSSGGPSFENKLFFYGNYRLISTEAIHEESQVGLLLDYNNYLVPK